MLKRQGAIATAITATVLTAGNNPLIRELTDTMTQGRKFTRLQLTVALFMLCASPVRAGDWDITPRLLVGAGYSDNIDLVTDGEGDWAAEVTPGISLRGDGARVSAILDYQLQNVFFLENSDANGSYHQLNTAGTVEVSEGLFFVDASARAGQAVIDANSSISVGNINSSVNRADFLSYTVSPYLQSHFVGTADGALRYTYSDVLYNSNAVSDATIQTVDANLASGRNFKQASWYANYYYSQQDRDSASDLVFENFSSEARHGLNNSFSLVGQAGYQNNHNVSNRNVNGPYWAVGGNYHPSRFYSLEALTGKNLTTATIGLFPTVRTSFLANYRDSSVGTNPGPKWTWSFNHYTRRTTWNARYFEETTTTQQLTTQTDVNIFGVDPITGEVNANPQPGDLTVEIPTEINSLTDEVFERKRGSGSFGMKTGKSSLLFTVWDERREGLDSGTVEKTRGITGTWNRRLAPRTNSLLTAYWQRRNDDLSGDDEETIFWFIRTSLVHRLTPRTRGTVEYRYTKQEAEEGRRSNYTENRIFARLIMTI